MKKTLSLLLISACLIAACQKDKDPVTPDTNNPADTTKTHDPVVSDGFVWQEDGGAEIQADSAFWTTWSNGTGVRAYKGGMANFFEINWGGADNTNVGTASLPASSGVTFLKGADTYSNVSKELLTITAFSNDQLSGNFTATLTGGSINTVKVTFTKLPKR